MKLNALACALVNNPVREPALHASRTARVGQHVLEIGCGRGTGLEVLLVHCAARVTGFDLDPAMVWLATSDRRAVAGSRWTANNSYRWLVLLSPSRMQFTKTPHLDIPIPQRLLS